MLSKLSKLSKAIKHRFRFKCRFSKPPFSVGEPVAFELRITMLSAIVTASECTYVVVPETVKLPPIVALPVDAKVVNEPAFAPPVTALAAVAST